jgi:pimeloyl-ACP methyl ester carboxylesterase
VAALNHHRSGSGEPLVLIHGTGSQWQVWRTLIERLAPHRDVIAVDLPGFGETPPLDAPVVTPLQFTDVVEGFLDELGLERPVIGGNSLGGSIGLELARRGRARSVVAMSPAGFWTPREQRWCVTRLRVEQRIARVVADHAPRLPFSPVARTVLVGGMIGTPWRMPGWAAHEAIANFGRSPGLWSTTEGLLRYTFADGDGVRAPVTIVWGNRDALLLPRQADRAARVIPGAELVRIPGAGHVPTWDAPDQIAPILLAA